MAQRGIGSLLNVDRLCPHSKLASQKHRMYVLDMELDEAAHEMLADERTYAIRQALRLIRARSAIPRPLQVPALDIALCMNKGAST